MTGTNLHDARERVMKKRYDPNGVICPCCDGIAKVYRRKFTRTLARILLVMKKWDDIEPGSFHHVKNEWPLKQEWFNAEYARMVDLGLIEEMQGEREDGNPHVGFHRITDRGKQFVRGYVPIPKYVYCYKGRVIDTSETDTITFEDALGLDFNYRELWT